MNLYSASNQWAKRPDDERFESLAALYDASRGIRESARESTVIANELRVEPSGDDIVITRDGINKANVTNWAFGQLCARSQAPAGFLRSLPVELAAQNLNHCLSRSDDDREVKLLFHQNGDMVLRALTSERYSRIWNFEIAERLTNLPGGWRVPPARPAKLGAKGTRFATEADCLTVSAHPSLGIKPGDVISPANIYMSDHDLFVFLVNEDRPVKDGSVEGMCRGVFVENSEVGASSLKLTAFLYRYLCGNMICWGASNVTEMALRHVGSANERWGGELEASIGTYADDAVSDLEDKIRVTQRFSLGAKKEDVLDKLFGTLGVGRKMLDAAYVSTVEHPEDGAPNTAWGMAQGLTRISQALPHADARMKLDLAAAKVLEAAF